jgi:hypothetical protein
LTTHPSKNFSSKNFSSKAEIIAFSISYLTSEISEVCGSFGPHYPAYSASL